MKHNTSCQPLFSFKKKFLLSSRRSSSKYVCLFSSLIYKCITFREKHSAKYFTYSRFLKLDMQKSSHLHIWSIAQQCKIVRIGIVFTKIRAMAIFNFFRLESTKVKWVISANNGTISQEVEGSKIGVSISTQSCRFIIHQHSTRLEECIRLSGLQMTLQKLQTSFFVCAKKKTSHTSLA